MRILLDTNILVRANELSHGPARTLLRRLIEQHHTLLMSRVMLMELSRALRYPHLQALYGLSDDQIYHYIQFLQEVCELVVVEQTLNVPIRDPKDIAMLQTAVAGKANIICTRDKDFSAPVTLKFCANVGIEICADLELLRRTQV